MQGFRVLTITDIDHDLKEAQAWLVYPVCSRLVEHCLRPLRAAVPPQVHPRLPEIGNGTIGGERDRPSIEGFGTRERPEVIEVLGVLIHYL